MKKHLKNILSLCLAFSLCFSLGATAFAAEIDTSGGSGSTPVNLTTTNGGIGGGESGDVSATKLSVIVPTVLPVAMADDGTVVTATDCKIVNRSYGAVRVKTVTISAASGWHLTRFGDKSILAGEKVDANKLGFAMSIGGGKQVATATDSAAQTLISAPVQGCYLTGAGDTSGSVAQISYSAIITPLSGTVNNATIASVVFVVEWDTAD